MLRKFDSQKKTSHRETKQANILPSLFKSSSCTDTGGPKVMFTEGAQDKLLKIIMRLFERVVDLSKPFNITLIGLAFSKFQQRKVGSSSIASFLIKKTDLEVQSITSLTNTDVDGSIEVAPSTANPSQISNNDDEGFRSSPTTFQPSDQFYRRRNTAASPIPMLLDNGSESGATNSDFSDFSETEIEPSPKKSRLSRLVLNKRRCFGSSAIQGTTCDTPGDVASPSKLRVCDLRLNSRDSDREFSLSPSISSAAAVACHSTPSALPSSAANISSNSQRFCPVQAPPSTLLSCYERLDDFRVNALHFSRQHALNTHVAASQMDDYSEQIEKSKDEKSSPNVTKVSVTSTLSNIPCPAGVDPDVFNELPVDVQQELIASWRSSLAAAAAAVANSTIPTSSSSDASQATTNATSTAKAGVSINTSGTQKNTLYRYFLRNK